MNKTKSLVNIFINHCEWIDTEFDIIAPSTAISWVLLTLVDPNANLEQELSNITLPPSTKPYQLIIDHGIKNGIECDVKHTHMDFSNVHRFTQYDIDETGQMIGVSTDTYSLVSHNIKQQADSILIRHLSTMSKDDIIMMLLGQKHDLLVQTQSRLHNMCMHTVCDDCGFHRTHTCPTDISVPNAQDWLHFLNEPSGASK